MRKAALAVSVAFAVLTPVGSFAPCQDTSESRLFVIGFSDPGPPAIHSVQAKMSDNPDAVWSSIPANISLSDDGLHFKATVEVPDVRWGVFRVKRDAMGEAGALTVGTVAVGNRGGLLFAVDVAYANLVTNEDFRHSSRFSGLIAGVHFTPGEILVGFRADVTEQEVRAFFEAGGLGLEVDFPKVFHLECEVLSGDISDHVEALDESGMVLRTETMPWLDPARIAVTFRADATLEQAGGLLSSIEGLEADWTSLLQAEKTGAVYVPEGNEFGWILVLERHRMITYAEPSYIFRVW